MNLYEKLEEKLQNYSNFKLEIVNFKIEIDNFKIEIDNLKVNLDQNEQLELENNNFYSIMTIKLIKKTNGNKPKMIELLEKLIKNLESEINKIDNSLKVLSDLEKEVIELRYFNKLSRKQISSNLNINEAYVYQVKRRAIEKLVPIYFYDVIDDDLLSNVIE